MRVNYRVTYSDRKASSMQVMLLLAVLVLCQYDGNIKLYATLLPYHWYESDSCLI